MAEFASRGVGNAGLTTGIIGSALGALNSGVLGGGGILGGWNNNGMVCSENQLVNRYEAELQMENAKLRQDVALRDSNTYTDQKLLEVYRYFDGKLNEVNGTLCSQAVMNQKTADSFDMVRNDMICCKNELYTAIARERDERCCGDNAIVTYANATFYPKMVADVTTGTETTAQTLYNPVTNCGCCHR